jgi:hypothetical protein
MFHQHLSHWIIVFDYCCCLYCHLRRISAGSSITYGQVLKELHENVCPSDALSISVSPLPVHVKLICPAPVLLFDLTLITANVPAPDLESNEFPKKPWISSFPEEGAKEKSEK